MPRILPQGPADLPPAGDARREELKARTDDLAEKAEALSAERGTIDPDAFDIDPEIASRFNELEVPNARSDYRYCWVQCSSQYYGRFVNAKRTQGWAVVHASDDDAPADTTQVDGTCRIGDVLLMRIRADRYVLLKRALEERQRKMDGAPENELREMADKYSPYGINVSINDPRQLKQMAARGVAMKGVDQLLRTGNVPGMPRPGSGR